MPVHARTPFETFQSQIDCIIKDDRETQIQLYSEDCTYEVPFATDRPRFITGRDGIRRVAAAFDIAPEDAIGDDLAADPSDRQQPIDRLADPGGTRHRAQAWALQYRQEQLPRMRVGDHGHNMEEARKKQTGTGRDEQRRESVDIAAHEQGHGKREPGERQHSRDVPHGVAKSEKPPRRV